MPAIAVEKNTGVGTGTLITDGTNRFILTAAHVIEDADIGGIRYWLRPNTALTEKVAIDTTNAEVGRMTAGTSIPIIETGIEPKTDIALLRIPDSFVLPDGAEFYHLVKSLEFASWPDDALDEISMLMFGFPVGNSRPIKTIGNNTICFLGVASMLSRYSKELNKDGFKKLPYQFSAEKDFLLEYTGIGTDIHPRGFSGCGVWIPTETKGSSLWWSEPMLIGVANQYFKRLNVIASTKLPSIVTMTPLHTVVAVCNDTSDS